MKILFLFPILFLLSCQNPPSISDQLENHVHYLASDKLEGRYPVTKGDTLSQKYIRKIFEENLSSKSVFLQKFPFLNKILASELNKVSIKISDSLYELKHNKDFVVFPQSGSNKLSGEPVFIGYGINDPEKGYDDYRKVNLNGKIAICYLTPPKEIEKDLRKLSFKLNTAKKTRLLKSLGCKAVIFVLPKSYRKHDSIIPLKEKNRFSQKSEQEQIPILRLSYTAFEDLMKNININIDDFNGTLFTSKTSLAFELPETYIDIDIEVRYEYNSTTNIVGFLRGKDTTQSIIIGAHYDHLGIKSNHLKADSIYNGADDNASGIAVLLEIAKLCSKNSKYDCNIYFIAFGAEEVGLVGSHYFLNNLPKNIGNIKCMINYDMVGRMRDSTLYINHSKSAKEWINYLSTMPNYNFNFFYDKDVGVTDSYNFIREGIPSLWFFTGYHSDYHRPSDEYEKLNYVGMGKVVLFSNELVNLVSQSSNKLRYLNNF